MEKTLELQKLIDNNSYVKIEKGVYLTAPLFLHSNMTLEIEDGAILKATLNERKYVVLLLISQSHIRKSPSCSSDLELFPMYNHHIDSYIINIFMLTCFITSIIC